jgi:hypothetical protein
MRNSARSGESPCHERLLGNIMSAMAACREFLDLKLEKPTPICLGELLPGDWLAARRTEVSARRAKSLRCVFLGVYVRAVVESSEE